MHPCRWRRRWERLGSLSECSSERHHLFKFLLGLAPRFSHSPRRRHHRHPGLPRPPKCNSAPPGTLDSRNVGPPPIRACPGSGGRSSSPRPWQRTSAERHSRGWSRSNTKCLPKNRDELLAFYDPPAEPCRHPWATNPCGSRRMLDGHELLGTVIRGVRIENGIRIAMGCSCRRSRALTIQCRAG